MTAVWARARSQLRRGAVGVVALGLFVAIAGGVVLTAIAGARRSDAALPAFISASIVEDSHVNFAPPADDPDGSRSTFAGPRDALASIPGVTAAVRGAAVILAPPAGAPLHPFLGFLPMDEPETVVLGHPIVVAGRLPHPTAAREIAVDEQLAAEFGLTVGAQYRFRIYTVEQAEAAGEGQAVEPAGPRVDGIVTGIIRTPEDVVPPSAGAPEVLQNQIVFLSPAFWTRYGPDIARYGVNVAVTLRDDSAAGRAAFAAAVEERFPGRAFVAPPESSGGESTAGAGRAIDLETAALLGFALVAALAGAFLVAQILGRQGAVDARDDPVLRILGMTRRQIISVALIRGLVIGVIGMVGAVMLAIGLSPLTPIGIARRADIRPGIRVDAPVLASGAVVILLFVLASTAVVALRRSRPTAGVHAYRSGDGPQEGTRRGWIARSFAGVTMPLTTAAGFRMAFDRGRGPAPVPTRAALLALAAAVAAVTMAVGFDASLASLRQDPARWGATWDLSAGNFASQDGVDRGAALLAADPDVASFTGVNSIEGSVDGQRLGFEVLYGSTGRPPVLITRGRAPRGAGEIALAAGSLESLGKRIGDTVEVKGERKGSMRLRIVGVAVPAVPGSEVVSANRGAVVGGAVANRMLAAENPYDLPSFYVIELRPGAEIAAVRARLEEQFPRTVAGAGVEPQDLRSLQRVSYLPLALALTIAVLAAGTVAHALIVSIRRRRKELAVLETLGFRRRQISSTIAWQATAFAVAALLIGIPLGIAGARLAWRWKAADLGMVSGPVVEFGFVVGLAVAVLVVVNAIAVVPGRRATRRRPAVTLRSE